MHMTRICQMQNFATLTQCTPTLKLCDLTVDERTNIRWNSTGDTRLPLSPTSLWRILLLLSSLQKSENMVVCTKSRPLRNSHEASQSRRKTTALLRRTLALSHRSPQPPRPKPTARHTVRNISHALYLLQLPVCFSAPPVGICGGLGRSLKTWSPAGAPPAGGLSVCVLLGGSPCCLGELLKRSSSASCPLVWNWVRVAVPWKAPFS